MLHLVRLLKHRDRDTSLLREYDLKILNLTQGTVVNLTVYVVRNTIPIARIVPMLTYCFKFTWGVDGEHTPYLVSHSAVQYHDNKQSNGVSVTVKHVSQVVSLVFQKQS